MRGVRADDGVDRRRRNVRCVEQLSYEKWLIRNADRSATLPTASVMMSASLKRA